MTADHKKSDYPIILENVSTADVTLLDKYLLNAEAKTIEYLLELEPQRFLYNWYRTSGLKPQKNGYENSWERTNEINFRGHMFGHYMSALSQAYAAEKDEPLKAALLQKIKSCVNGIVECQRAYADKYPDRAGYTAPFSEYWLNNLDGLESGTEAWNEKEADNPNTYVPWYNLHKVIAGLIDVFKYVKNDSIGELAFEAVQKFVDYVYNCRVSKYTEFQKANMLKTEYGGIAESLFELYNLTGKDSYRVCAEGFMETPLFEALAANNDVLNGKHANTTIPKLIGSLKKYTVLTQNKKYYDSLTKEEQSGLKMYLTAAKNFFDIVLTGHSFVTGGNSVAEHFRQANTISEYCNHAETHETCNEYNMLKLSVELFKITNDKKYADYYEKTFINSILSSQNPTNGEMTYFQPMGSGYSKVFNKERFWCCTGTGIESFTKLGSSIYFKKKNRIYVNMYFSSVLQDSERNIIVTIDANLPNSEKVKLNIKGLNGGNVEEGTDLYIRIPNWCADIPSMIYNGGKIIVAESEYVIIKNVKHNDEIVLVFPMQVTVEPLADNPNIAAFTYGPVVLAARFGQENVGQNSDTGIMVLRSVRDTSLPVSIILKSDSVEEWKTNITENLVRISDSDDGFIQFKVRGTYFDDNITFVPYYSIYNYYYSVYMNIAELDSAEMTEEIMANKLALRNEDASSALITQIDGNNYEATYSVRTSSDSRVGSYKGRNFRDAAKGGWFSYDLPIVEGTENYLNTVYASDEEGRSFEILINGNHFVTENISRKDVDFYTKTYAIPPSYTNSTGLNRKNIAGVLTPYLNIKFKSIGGTVGGLYGISVTQNFDDNPNLTELYFDQGTLSPEFNQNIKEYHLTVTKEASSIQMKATPTKASCLVYFNDILIDDTQMRTIILSPKTTVLTLKTYAQNHTTATHYTINILYI